MIGIALALLAALGWGGDAVLSRQGMRQVPPALATLISIGATLVVVVGMALVIDPGGFARLTPAAVLWFAGLGLINFPLGRQLNMRATHLLGSSRAASTIAASPLIAMLVAWLLGEALTWPLLLGAGLIVLGVALVVSSR